MSSSTGSGSVTDRRGTQVPLADAIRRDIAAKLQATGRYTPDEADAQGRLFARVIGNLAERAGVTPAALYERYRIQVEAFDGGEPFAETLHQPAYHGTPHEVDREHGGSRGVGEALVVGGGVVQASSVAVTETDAFKRWFGDSKVVDEQGRPLVVYHGTPESAPTIHERFEYAERRAAEIAQQEEAGAWSAVISRINDVLQSAGEKARVSTPRDVRNAIDLWGEDFFGRDVVEMLNSIPSWRGIYDPVTYLEERREKLTEDDIRVLERAPFAVFDDKKLGRNTGARDAKVGFFFTNDRDFARRFTVSVEKDPMTGRVRTWQGDRPMLYEVYLSIKNPIDLSRATKKNAEALFKSGLLRDYDTAEDLRRDMASAEGSKLLQQILAAKGKDALIAAGFDGIINKVRDHDGRKVRTEFIAFRPEQIKSATGNRGTFDPKNPNILFQRGADADPIKPPKFEEGELIHGTTGSRKEAAASQPHGDAMGHRGALLIERDRSMRILFFPAADLTTFLHESAHVFLEVLRDVSALPGADPSLAEDFDAVLRWGGIRGRTPEQRRAAWDMMKLDQQRDVHEAFAEAFERYLQEAKVPEPDLAGVFARFRRWITAA